MSTLVVFFSGTELRDPPMDDDFYFNAYKEFGSAVINKGHAMFLVRGQDSYAGGNRFKRGWSYTNSDFVWQDNEIEADVIFNKGDVHFTYDAGAHVINDNAFDALCRNKMTSYKLFPGFFPRTFLLTQESDIAPAIARVRSQKAVLKPQAGYGGKGVVIKDTSEIAADISSYPYILQEFIDSSGGIPGITSGTHDLRMLVINDDISLLLLRVPAHNSLIANVSMGGTIRNVPLSALPAGARVIFEKVSSRFSTFPKKTYSIDCALDADGTWKVIELNPQPGLMSHEDCGDAAKGYFDDLIELLLTHVKLSEITKGRAKPKMQDTQPHTSFAK